MKTIIVRKNRLFTIDRSVLKEEAKRDDICNALYAAVYLEFIGASKNPTYRDKTPKDLLLEVNKFANKWLQKKGLL